MQNIEDQRAHNLLGLNLYYHYNKERLNKGFSGRTLQLLSHTHKKIYIYIYK